MKIKELFDPNKHTFKCTYVSHNEQETIALAMQIASFLQPGDILVLDGELGAGKTKFVSGIAQFYHIENQVSSPTFTIVNEYQLPTQEKLFHFDVYRLADSNDFLDSIGTEYFETGICLIEWGSIIQDILPNRTIYLTFQKDTNDENIRHIQIRRNIV